MPRRYLTATHLPPPQARLGHRWVDDPAITLFGRRGALPTAIRDSRLLPLNDLYALSAGCLLSDVVEYHERERERSGSPYEPRAVIADVLSAVKHVHASGEIHREVRAAPSLYGNFPPRQLPYMAGARLAAL